MTEKIPTTLTGVAFVLVALSRFNATTNPALAGYLRSSFESAAKAGVSPEDLELLSTVINAVSLN